MSKFSISVAIIVLATALSAAAYAEAPQKSGAAKGGAPHASGGAAQAGGVARGSGGAGVSTRSTISRSSARSSSGGNVVRSTARNTRNRSATTRNTRNRSATTRNTLNRSVGSRALTTSSRNATRNAKKLNATSNAKLNATSNAKLNANVKSNAVRNTLKSRSVAGALSNKSALSNPVTRAGITASAATAGWQKGGHDRNGWWQHGSGGYGWVGPLFWPFAYYDMYDYAMWGYGYDDSFWGYGYGDIYAGLFAPYGYDDLAGYYPPEYASANPSDLRRATRATGPQRAPIDQLAQMCGQDSRDIAGLPIDRFQQAIQPTGEQRAALDDLANASLKAAQDIRAACPTDIALTAPDRLAAMQQRIEAMISGVATVQPALEKFYGLLNDEQKARLTALGKDQHQNRTAEKTTGSLAQTCGAAQPGVMEWPTAGINQTVRPTDAQRASLEALQNASAKTADMLKSSCAADDALTPPARLAAVGKRLDTMLEAVKTVRSALNDFYASLNDEQKAQFEAIGPQRTSKSMSAL
jgi:hypothetical protein